MTEETKEAVEVTAAKPEPKREMFSREYVEELREEAKSVRLKANEYKSQLEDQARQNAEALTAKEQALEALKQEARTELAMAKLEALAVKAGIVDPDALALLDKSAIKFDDAGKVTNADEVLKAFKESKPHFFGSTNTSSTEKAPNPIEEKKGGKVSDADWEKKRREIGLP